MGVAEDNLPFLLGPAEADIAVLLVHGFTATPWEMRLLAEYLADRGLCALAVRLPGHGTTPEDLRPRTWQEWLEAVNQGHALLEARHRHIFGIGMSTGSLLLLASILERPFTGLVLCAPYLQIRHRLAGHSGWLRWLRAYHNKTGSVDQDPHYYDRRPLAGIHQIHRLIDHLRSRLGACQAPVLAFNSLGDQTILPASGKELMGKLGSAFKLHVCYGPEVPHILTREVNPLWQQTFSLIGNFIAEVVNPGEFNPAGSHAGP